jgi:hypothetical protein
MPQTLDPNQIKALRDIVQDYESLTKSASGYVEDIVTSLDKTIIAHKKDLELGEANAANMESILATLKEQGKTNTKNYKILTQSLQTQINKNLEMDLELSLLEKQQGVQNIIKNGTVDIFKSFQEVNSSAGQFYGLMKSLSNPLNAVFAVLKLSAERFSSLDLEAEKFRKETGLLISQTKQIDRNIKEVSVDLQRFGVGIEESYNAAKQLTETFGDQFAASNKENIEYVSLMSSNLGVAAEDSAKVMQNFMGISKTSSETARYMSAQAVSLSKAAGVPLAKVMKDVANASGETLALIRGNVNALIKASVEARRLGTSLESVGNSASKLLDFQTSISDEMEASVLLGRDINLQRMRQLAYEGDLASVAQEQANIISKAGKMDYYQQKALANALGLSVEQFTQMAAKQEELSELRKKDPEFAKQYQAYLEESSKLNKNNIEDLKTKYTQEMKIQQVQAVQTKLANQFKALLVDIADVFTPIFTVLSLITSGLSYVVDFLALINKYTNNWGAGTLLILTMLLPKMRSVFVAPLKLGLSLMTKYASGLKNMFTGGGGFIGPQLPKTTTPSTGMFGSLSNSIKSIKPAQLLSIGVAMVAFAGAVFILAEAAKVFGGPEAQAGFANMLIAAGSLAALTVGLVALSTLLTAASPIIVPAIGIMLAFAASIGILSLAAMGFGKAFQFFVAGFESLANLNLVSLSGGMLALSGAMYALGSSMAVGGLLSFAGGGLMLQLGALALMAPRLSIAADSLNSVAESLNLFKDDEVVEGIHSVKEAIQELNKEINNINLTKIGALAALSIIGSNSSTSTSSGNSVTDKLDELIDLLKSGAIGVNIDGSKASTLLFKAQKERGLFGSI